MKNNRVYSGSSWLGGVVAVACLLVASGASAQVTLPVPAAIPEPMPAATPHLRQVTVGRVVGTLQRSAVRTQAARSWAAVAACVQQSGARVRQVSIRFVVVLGRSPELLLVRGAPAARACVAREVATWSFGGGVGTASVTFRTRGIDAVVAGVVSRTPVPTAVTQGAGQLIEAGHEVLGTQ